MKQKAFTLIELLVVISIIGLLSSVVLASLSTARAKSRDTLRVQHLIQIRTALAQYALNNNGAYPASDNTGTNNAGGTGDWSAATKAALAPYISKVPIDPVLNQSAPGWQTYGFTYCDTASPNNNCSWLNSPQSGQACPGMEVVYAYNTEGKAKFVQCSATGVNLMITPILN